MQCPRCQHENPIGQKFCGECGTRLGQGDGPARFWTSQSQIPKHLVEKILTSKLALEGERKQVTVLFADLKGSMELIADRDPEEARKLLDPVLEHMMEAVHRYEGTVNQVMGDGIMALFGAPIAHEDHARRACHAALEIERGFTEYAARLRREKGFGIQVRLGLNSGPVVVGAIGDDLRMDYTAQGLTTNLAARMQQAADPGAILVAAATHRLVEGYFRVRSLGALRVRGAAEPVDAYVLEGEGTVGSRLQASLRRGVSPFRGREGELGLLAEAWERTAAGRGDAICLVGEPGIGKSRLAWELQRHLGLPDPVEGAAQAFARGAAYFAFRLLLRQLAALEPDADLAAAREDCTWPPTYPMSFRFSARPARRCRGTRRPTDVVIACKTRWSHGSRPNVVGHRD